jgi:hypothetical protein
MACAHGRVPALEARLRQFKALGTRNKRSVAQQVGAPPYIWTMRRATQPAERAVCWYRRPMSH